MFGKLPENFPLFIVVFRIIFNSISTFNFLLMVDIFARRNGEIFLNFNNLKINLRKIIRKRRRRRRKDKERKDKER